MNFSGSDKLSLASVSRLNVIIIKKSIFSNCPKIMRNNPSSLFEKISKKNIAIFSVYKIFGKKWESYFFNLCKAIGLNVHYLCFAFNLQRTCAASRIFALVWQWSLTLFALSSSRRMSHIQQLLTFPESFPVLSLNLISIRFFSFVHEKLLRKILYF